MPKRLIVFICRSCGARYEVGDVYPTEERARQAATACESLGEPPFYYIPGLNLFRGRVTVLGRCYQPRTHQTMCRISIPAPDEDVWEGGEFPPEFRHARDQRKNSLIIPETALKRVIERAPFAFTNGQKIVEGHLEVGSPHWFQERKGAPVEQKYSVRVIVPWEEEAPFYVQQRLSPAGPWFFLSLEEIREMEKDL
jgi:hypothetical protein